MTFILLSFTIVLLLSALVVIHTARTSAEGYEDEAGFHFTGAKRAVISTQSHRSVTSLSTLTQPPFPIRG